MYNKSLIHFCHYVHIHCCNNCVCMLHVTCCMSTCVTRLFLLFCRYIIVSMNIQSLLLIVNQFSTCCTSLNPIILSFWLTLSVLSPFILHVKTLTRFHVSCTASGALCPHFCCIRCQLSFCSYFVYSPFLLPYRRSPTPIMRLPSPIIHWWQMVDGWTCMFWRNRSVSIHCMCETTCLYFLCLCYFSFHFNFVNDVVHVACTYFYALIDVYVYICDAGMHVVVRLHEGVWGQRLVGVLLLFILFICCLISFFFCYCSNMLYCLPIAC